MRKTRQGKYYCCDVECYVLEYQAQARTDDHLQQSAKRDVFECAPLFDYKHTVYWEIPQPDDATVSYSGSTQRFYASPKLGHLIFNAQKGKVPGFSSEKFNRLREHR